METDTPEEHFDLLSHPVLLFSTPLADASQEALCEASKLPFSVDCRDLDIAAWPVEPAGVTAPAIPVSRDLPSVNREY